jgi:hypothetical protein
MCESLEARMVLTTFYVDANLALVADRDSSGGLSAGDQVTFGQGQTYEQANLTYDAAPTGGDTGTAFNSISQALASPLVQAGDTIDVAGGTYAESISIDKSLTIAGFGAVVLQGPSPGDDVGVSITGDPDSVTLRNLTVQQFNIGISCAGAHSLTLSDVTLLQEYEGATVAGLSELNFNTTAIDPQDVTILSDRFGAVTSSLGGAVQSFAAGASATVGTSSDHVVTFGTQSGIYFNSVSTLNVSTGSGSDRFNVAPLTDTVVNVDGGDPTPPSSPGDELFLPVSSAYGDLAVSGDATGFFGTLALTYAKPVNFRHFETLPGTIKSVGPGGRTVDSVEGEDMGAQVLATFRDLNTALPVSAYSADIDWGDGKHSTGTIAYDSASGTFAVSGSHVYDEDGTYHVSITVRSTASPTSNDWMGAVVYVSEPPIAGTGVTLHGTEGAPLWSDPSGFLDVAEFSHGNNTENQLEFSATVDWGDGSVSTNQQIPMYLTGPHAGSYFVDSRHTYREAGTYKIKVTITDDAATTTVISQAIIAERPLPGGIQGTPNQRFIAEVYEDLLNRTVDPDAVTYWAAKLDAGVSRPEVVAGIQNSDEFRHNEINALFQSYLHRGAEQGALDADNKLLLQGETLEQLAAVIVSSEEYFQQRGGGTNDGFLTALFQDALDRQIDYGAKTSFEQELAHGVTRAQVADQVFGSKEYRSVEVQNLYQQAFDRDADQAGVAYWTDKLAHGMRDEQALAAIMGSQEYFDKTQP